MYDGRLSLGICGFVHNSSAALVHEGSLIGFSEEDKLNQEKHFGGYPERTVSWLLRKAGVAERDVRVVAYNWNGALLAECAKRYGTRGNAEYSTSLAAYYERMLGVHAERMAQLRARFPNSELVEVPHHETHARYAFLASEWDEAAVLIVDSNGEGVSTTIAEAGPNTYREKLVVRDPHSLGYIYGAVCEHLGFQRNDEEGTVMALGGYGDPARFARLFEQLIAFTEEGFVLDSTLVNDRGVALRERKRLTEAFVRLAGPARPSGAELEDRHRDLAAALQQRTAQSLQHLATLARARTGKRKLCVAGGVALNCSALGRLRASGIFDDVFIPPAPGDSGTSLGAVLTATRANHANSILRRSEFRNGPVVTDDTVLAELARRGLAFTTPADVSQFLAAKLVEQRIIGVCVGAQEDGPRALGNRSILAAPDQLEMRHRINREIKFRQDYRPVAPLILRERMSEWFEQDWDCPYMSFAARVRPEKRSQIPAALHVDGTARLQTVDRVGSPFLHRLLVEYERLTGLPVLLNTSLNLKGFPIASEVPAALDCYASSRLDGILVGSHYVSRD